MVSMILPDAREWIGAMEAGQQAGEADRKTKATRRAGGLMTGGDYAGAAREVMPYDMRTGVAIQQMGQAQAAEARKKGYGASLAAGKGDEAVKSAQAGGDFEIAGELQKQIDAADDRSKKIAHEKAARIAEIVAPLGDMPEADMAGRKAYIAQHRADLLAAGYTDQQIDTFEPTNANLVPIYTQAMGLKEYLERSAPKVVGNSLVKPDGKVVYRDPQVRNLGPGERLVEYGGAPGVGPAPEAAATAEGPVPTGGIYGTIGQIATSKGAKPEEVSYLQRLAQVESHGDPQAQNGSSTGVFQFHPDTFASVGGSNIHDVGDQTAAALALSRRDREGLQALGIQPTDANVYIMHQQGPGGGRALLTAPPEAKAVDVLTPIYGSAKIAQQAIVGNGGTADMTAGQFTDMWRQRWGAGGRPVTQVAGAGAPAAAAPATGPGVRVLAEGGPRADAPPPTGYRYKPDGSLAFIPGGPADPATKTSAGLKPIPAKVQTGYADNAKGMTQIDQAIAEIRRNPGALGGSPGGFIRNALGDNISQRADPGGVKTRAALANIGSLIIHDRSGAAVTAAETPRLLPFIPQVTDTPETAIKKLEGLKEQYRNANDQIEVQFGEESGYRPLVPHGPAGAPALKADPNAIASAKAAIAKGAPRDKVIERLREHGIDPAGL